MTRIKEEFNALFEKSKKSQVYFYWYCKSCNAGFKTKGPGVPEQFIIECPLCQGEALGYSTIERCSKERYNQCGVRDTW